MQNHDMYSYAIITIDTHGFDIKAHTKYSFRAREKLGMENYFELNLFGPDDPQNPWFCMDEVDKVVRDRRNIHTYLMFYKSGKSEQDVLELIYPQVLTLLRQYVVLYRVLADNAHEMAIAVEQKQVSHICKPMQ